MVSNSEFLNFAEFHQTKLILVVEDDIGIGDFLIQAILQETHYQVKRVNDGFQALESITSIKPHLFILDFQLPKINGIELYDKLHTLEGLETIPAIIISARLPKQEIEKRKLIGMRKPIELDDFLRTLDKLLS